MNAGPIERVTMDEVVFQRCHRKLVARALALGSAVTLFNVWLWTIPARSGASPSLLGFVALAAIEFALWAPLIDWVLLVARDQRFLISADQMVPRRLPVKLFLRRKRTISPAEVSIVRLGEQGDTRFAAIVLKDRSLIFLS